MFAKNAVGTGRDVDSRLSREGPEDSDEHVLRLAIWTLSALSPRFSDAMLSLLRMRIMVNSMAAPVSCAWRRCHEQLLANMSTRHLDRK